jgi:hypothetical protein
MRYWNIARQRHCCGSARCLRALRLSADRAENAASKPARKAGVLDPEEKVPRETDSPLEGGVSCELVSENAKFPASRENTGNFIDSGLGGASEAAKKGMKSVSYGPIPYAS